jgi:hypothetical protein
MKPKTLFNGLNQRRICNGKGFTRVDLIALLAMVTCIAVITRASLASAGRVDSQSVCLENLKELMRAWAAYANDYDGAVVDATKWTGGQWLNLPVQSVEEIDPYAPQGIASSPPDVHWLQYRATRRVEQVDALRFRRPQLVGEKFQAGVAIRDNREYDFETSADLVNWKPMDEIDSADGAVEAAVNDTPTRFFRARRRE